MVKTAGAGSSVLIPFKNGARVKLVRTGQDNLWLRLNPLQKRGTRETTSGGSLSQRAIGLNPLQKRGTRETFGSLQWRQWKSSLNPLQKRGTRETNNKVLQKMVSSLNPLQKRGTRETMTAFGATKFTGS